MNYYDHTIYIFIIIFRTTTPLHPPLIYFLSYTTRTTRLAALYDEDYCGHYTPSLVTVTDKLCLLSVVVLSY